jgi:preprotein translocase SecE subunit
LSTEERFVSDTAPGASKRADESRLGGGGLKIYKGGQGYYTRVGTAIGAGVMAIWGVLFINDQFINYLDPKESYAAYLRFGVDVGVLAILSGLVYWVVGLNRKANDFFIATEGEMKKVSWSSWPDVIRSTQVVIFAVVAMGIFLFVADLFFMRLFGAIGVLKGIPSLTGN